MTRNTLPAEKIKCPKPVPRILLIDDNKRGLIARRTF